MTDERFAQLPRADREMLLDALDRMIDRHNDEVAAATKREE